jgi:subtilisin family serine protease
MIDEFFTKEGCAKIKTKKIKKERNMKRKILLTVGISLIFLFFMSTAAFSANWILDSGTDDLPTNLEAKIIQAGGTLLKTLDGMGIAIAEFSTRVDAEAMEAYGLNVMLDIYVDWHESGAPNKFVDSDDLSMATPEATWYYHQWHIPVVEADKAWDAGEFGAGTRVAVIDSGIWYPHPDLNANIDFAASKSFVPGVTDIMDIDGHGTHVAGIIAANGSYRAKGIAPQATLIVIKALEGGGGYMSWAIEGIYHAVDQGADVINMSFGNYLKLLGNEPYYTAKDAIETYLTWAKAIFYAKVRGCLVVASAGNDAFDLDHSEDIVHVPSEAGAIQISATGPMGLEDFDRPASYTNYGKWSIFIAAPGGDNALSPADGWWYDMVYSTYIEGWAWVDGTSQAVPMVSGVAALVLSKEGPMNTWLLEYRLARTADKIGGFWFKHDYYGWGRVNAYRAVMNIK